MLDNGKWIGGCSSSREGGRGRGLIGCVYVYVFVCLCTYLSLQWPHQHPLQNLPRLVAVADIFKGFGCILAAYVEEDFFTATFGWELKEGVSMNSLLRLSVFFLSREYMRRREKGGGGVGEG